MNDCSIQQLLEQTLSQFLFLKKKTLCLTGFILKSTDKVKVLLKAPSKNGTRAKDRHVLMQQSLEILNVALL